MMKKAVRLLIALTSIVFMIWFIIPAFIYRIFNIGNILGIFICCAALFRSAFSPLYHRIKNRMLKKKGSRLLLRAVQIISVAFIAYCVTVSGFMISAMIPRAADGATAVVLGAQVKPWGPSAILRQRIDAAEEYLRDEPDADAVVTGGQGADEIMSEAECMKEVMIKDGISADRIYPEDKATDTNENIRFSLKVIEDNGLDKDIAIVTDSYHQLRARIIAHKADRGIKVSPINTKNNRVGVIAYPTYFVREWIAIPAEILK